MAGEHSRRIALAAVLVSGIAAVVSGVVGFSAPLISAQAARDAQEEEIRHQRAQTDLDELRSAFDNAVTALARLQAEESRAFALWYFEKKLPLSAAQMGGVLEADGALIDASSRLRVRLGPSKSVKTLDAAIDSLARFNDHLINDRPTERMTDEVDDAAKVQERSLRVLTAEANRLAGVRRTVAAAGVHNGSSPRGDRGRPDAPEEDAAVRVKSAKDCGKSRPDCAAPGPSSRRARAYGPF